LSYSLYAAWCSKLNSVTIPLFLAHYTTRQAMSDTIQFDLTTEYIELCNLLKLVGLADSGGRGKTMVAEGLVKVDGSIETRKTAKIRTGQTVAVGSQVINVK